MIPKITHQLWIGPYSLPSRYAHFRERLKTVMSAPWRHYFWTAGLLWDSRKHLSPRINALLGDPKINVVVKSDIIRFELLRSIGGFWLDTDMECLAPLDPFLSESFVCGWESPQHKTIGTAILGSEPDTELIHWLTASVVHNCILTAPTRDNQLDLSGPNLLTKIIRNEYPAIVPKNYQVFYPLYYDKTGITYPDSYTRHWWGGLESDGWKNNDIY